MSTGSESSLTWAPETFWYSNFSLASKKLLSYFDKFLSSNIKLSWLVRFIWVRCEPLSDRTVLTNFQNGLLSFTFSKSIYLWYFIRFLLYNLLKKLYLYFKDIFILIKIFLLMLFLAPKPYKERNQPLQISC